jgi:riboflavin synthase
MFTGIIEETGMLEKRAATPRGTQFAVRAPVASKHLKPGDSVAVNGVCQTVETATGDTFTFTSIAETLRRTTLSSVVAPVAVNLERAATVETALGGHIVQGHVDGVGRVEVSDGCTLTIRLPDELLLGVVEKGSIAVDGMSLTVAGVSSDRTISIAIVPYTVQHTVVGNYRPGSLVNIECDIIGKYVRRYLTNVHGAIAGATENEASRERGRGKVR